jgi:predicted nucleotidyltransferase
MYNNVLNHRGNNNWQIISSGSRAEGLNLPGSDYDVMHINKDINVYERDDVLSNYHDYFLVD